MLTGLLYNKPEDHLQFLGECINSARTLPNLTWDTFLDHSRKPLPAIPKANDGPIRSEGFGLTDEPLFTTRTFETEPLLEMKIQTKLPSITKDIEHVEDNIGVDVTINKSLVKEEYALPGQDDSFKKQIVIFVLGKCL